MKDDMNKLLVALEEAAMSLETIAAQAGRDEYLKEMLNVRGYANSRARCAREALASFRKDHEPQIDKCVAAFEAAYGPLDEDDAGMEKPLDKATMRRLKKANLDTE